MFGSRSVGTGVQTCACKLEHYICSHLSFTRCLRKKRNTNLRLARQRVISVLSCLKKSLMFSFFLSKSKKGFEAWLVMIHAPIKDGPLVFYQAKTSGELFLICISLLINWLLISTQFVSEAEISMITKMLSIPTTGLPQ